MHSGNLSVKTGDWTAFFREVTGRYRFSSSVPVASGHSLLYAGRQSTNVKAFTTDGREIECDAVDEGEYGAYLLDGDEQVGYVPYDGLAYVLELRSPVASSAIEAVGYDEDDGVLEIEFHHGGVYEYFDVPKEVYQDLLTAGSRGRYFHENVRGKYDYRRLR